MNKYQSQMAVFDNIPGRIQHSNHLSEADLDALEKKLGHSLPIEYRRFLHDFGGFFVATGVDISNCNDLPFAQCELFYGVMPDKPFVDLVTQYQWRRDDLPETSLPIAEGDNGRFYLILSGKEQGAIYFWHRGQGGGDEPEFIHFIASSFDEFMRLLEPCEG